MKKEYVDFASMIAWRFARGFVAGGIASLAALAQATPVHSLEALLASAKTWGITALGAAVAGGLMAIDKAMRSTTNP
jgi:hypothetical protein